MRAVLIGFLAANFSIAAGSQNKKSPPDVFLITIDTLRADHVHCYGYDSVETPAIDGLARDGIRFAQAFTPSPITNTSHVTILTGLLPSSHGVTDFGVPLVPSHPTWAELLHAHGYHTAAFIAAVILDSKALAPGLNRGFDFYDDFPEHSKTKSRWGRVERRGMDVVQRAEAWLNAHPQGPHFVWVHLYDPHDPYEPPRPYSQIYKDHLYDGEIAYADSALANFVGYLKRNHWYENSILVLVGDHGEGLGEHNEDTHGIFLYDSTTHVPLILKAPGSDPHSKVVTAQVRTTDIVPTVLDLTDVQAPSKLDGESLKPYFTISTGDELSERTAFGETDYPVRFGWAPLRSVRREGLKFIEAPKPELYDLRKDPTELVNQYEPWNAQVQKFRGMLAEIRAKTPPSNSTGAIGQATIEELKALGYLGRADAGSSTNVPEPSLLPDPKDRIEEQNLLHRAMISSDDGRTEAARESLERVLQLNPKSQTALRQLGELELHAGNYEKSARDLKAALRESPEDATVALEAGVALEKIHDISGARDALEVGLKRMPGDVQARVLLGQIYLELKAPKAAEDQFDAARLLNSSIDTQLSIAKAEIAGDIFDKAVEDLLAISKSHPRDAEVFELLAQAYSGSGKKTEAQRAEERARILRAKKTNTPP